MSRTLMIMIASLAFLTRSEVKSLAPELTLFIFPLGGIENHGTHLPVGTKLIQSEARASELAKVLQLKLPMWNFILMPLLPLSVDSITNRFALNVRPHVVRDAVVDQCEQLKKAGFQNFVSLSAQLTPKQLTALEDAAKIVSRSKWFRTRSAQMISVSGAWIDSKAVWESPMIALPREHAGAFDTGQMKILNPQLVSAEATTLPRIESPKANFARFIAFFKHELDGYWGHPAQASEESAQAQFANEIESVAQKMIPWLERGQGKSMFRSGYGYFPINGSFFSAYILATLFFLLMLIWVIWGVRDVFEA